MSTDSHVHSMSGILARPTYEALQNRAARCPISAAMILPEDLLSGHDSKFLTGQMVGQASTYLARWQVGKAC